MKDFFRHRSLIGLNRRALCWGALTLVAVDLVGSALPMIVKMAIDLLNDHSVTAPWAWLAAQVRLWNALPLWARTLSGAAGLASLVAFFIGVHALVAYFRYWWRVFLIWSSFPLADRMRVVLFNHLLSLPRDFYKRKKVGDLLSSLTTDTENMRNFLSVGALMIIDAAINFLIFPLLMLYLDIELTLCVIPLLVAASIGAIYVSGKIAPYYDAIQNLTGLLSAKTHELVGGIRTVKAFAVEDPAFTHYSAVNEDLKKAALVMARYEAFYSPGLEGVRRLALAFALLYGGQKVLEGHLALSSLVAFQMYLAFLDWPMMALGWSLQLYRRSQASAKRIQALMALESPLKVMGVEDPATEIRQRPPVLLACKGLEIVYSEGSPRRLGPYDFELHEGEWMGLTGSVGSGKSSLLECLSRQRDGAAGRVLFEGRDLRSLSPQELAQAIVYIPQEAFLFSASIRQNFTLGDPADLLRDERDRDPSHATSHDAGPHSAAKMAATDSALEALLRVLQFDEDIITQRGGLNARLGERGVNLSGGQRQRLSLGRALSRRRKLYLFDDVFSHIDLKTEATLIDHLKKFLPPQAAVILVSHRPSTLSYCDRILDLDRGADNPSHRSAERAAGSPNGLVNL